MKRKVEFVFLFLILVGSAFLRLYRLDKLLGFWYDQGRDALVIWDLLHYGKTFLIGPVTGIEGIFLGPFYYYLLTPFYWLGGGSPVFVTAGLSWLSVGTVFLIYLLAKKIFGIKTALLATILYGFSYNLILFSRWLANPNPLPFFTLVVLLLFYQALKGKSRYFIFACFVLGLCLQLEAAAATFFLPTFLIFLIWQRRLLFKPKILLLSGLAFGVTLLPQIYFNFRHEGILFQAFKKFLVADKSFGSGGSFWQTLRLRLLLYYDVFFSKIFPGTKYWSAGLLALFSAGLLILRKKLLVKESKFLVLWLIVPLVGYFFYRGNHGYIWDYYFCGLVPVFTMLLSAILVKLSERHWLGKIVVVIFLIGFLVINIRSLRAFYKTGIGITLAAETWALDWIYKDAGTEPFNIDVYVPPQIFFSYC